MPEPTTTIAPSAMLPPLPGVQYNPPPSHLLPSITKSITEAMASLRADEDAALVGISDLKGGYNAAFVARAPHGFEVLAWIGKSYGDGMNAGVAFRKGFKFGT